MIHVRIICLSVVNSLLRVNLGIHFTLSRLINEESVLGGQPNSKHRWFCKNHASEQKRTSISGENAFIKVIAIKERIEVGSDAM